jgi:hypothetical protein
MTDTDRQPTDPAAAADLAKLRTGLIDGLAASRAAEREIFAALDPAERDATGPDGGWSAKDVQAHLSAWRQHIADVLAALREGREDPRSPETAIDDINARLHDERADWPWDRVAADADSTAEALIAEVSAAGEPALTDPKVIATILGDGPEHDLGHLPELAAMVGLGSRALDLADTHLAILDRGGWPTRASAYARYNLACFHALAGNLDVARSLLRQALHDETELQALAPKDDDLIALRDEIPALTAGLDATSAS